MVSHISNGQFKLTYPIIERTELLFYKVRKSAFLNLYQTVIETAFVSLLFPFQRLLNILAFIRIVKEVHSPKGTKVLGDVVSLPLENLPKA